MAPTGTGTAPPTENQINDAFSKTYLRSIPDDNTDTDNDLTTLDAGRRSLFALGNKGSVLGSNADLASRFRLLGKVLKHTTTRSNTYVIYMTCDYYEALPVEPSPVGEPVYQIGQKIPADPADPEAVRFRAMYVVDRTLALEMLQERDLPGYQTQQSYPLPNQYQTFSFARERTSAGNGEPTFDWGNLVRYGKIIKSD